MSRRSGCGCATLLGFVLSVALGVVLCLGAQYAWGRYQQTGRWELPTWETVFPDGFPPEGFDPISLIPKDLVPQGLLPRAQGTGSGEVTVRDVSQIDEDGFAFAALPDAQKLLYAQMYEGLCARSESFEVTGATKEDVEPTFRAVLADHPELFWLDGSTSYTYYMDGGPITVTPNLNMPATEVDGTRGRIEEAVTEFLQTVPADADDYTKARLAYEYVIRTTDYDASAQNNQSIQSVFLGHSSVCAGYARAYLYLMQRMGIPCAYVEGSMPSTGQVHAWNLVCLDGTYTYVDVTWGDPTFVAAPDAREVTGLSYDYLGLTTAEILRDDHRFDDLDRWPPCDSGAYSYYAREGLLFDGYDPMALSESFWRQVSSGADAIVFKFASEDAYVAARDNLMAGDFLADDIAQVFQDRGESGSTYQYQYSNNLYILKLHL